MPAVSLEDALETCPDEVAKRAAAMLRSGEAHASSPVVKYGDLIRTLRIRLQIKCDQARASNQNVDRYSRCVGEDC
jgi:hypothetical protein